MIYDDLQAAADSKGSSWLHCRMHRYDLPLGWIEMEN